LYRTEVVPGGGGLQIRLIRDINLSAKHCLKGLFLKVKLFTAYLFGLNYKPFGKCVFGDKKHRLLETFMANNHEHSPLFLKYWERIANDWGMPHETDEHRTRIWELLPTKLESFSQRCGLPKLGRWFSWNAMVDQQGVSLYHL